MRPSGVQIWGDPELDSEQAERLMKSVWVLLIEHGEWQGSEQALAWGRTI